jgi:hypothetical protein
MFQFLRFSIFFLISRVLFLSVFFLYMTQKFTLITASTIFFKRRKLGELVKDPIMGPWIKRGKDARVRDSCLFIKNGTWSRLAVLHTNIVALITSRFCKKMAWIKMSPAVLCPALHMSPERKARPQTTTSKQVPKTSW